MKDVLIQITWGDNPPRHHSPELGRNTLVSTHKARSGASETIAAGHLAERVDCMGRHRNFASSVANIRFSSSSPLGRL